MRVIPGGNVNRPEFQKMMKLVARNKIQAVVCYKLDRVSRSLADFSEFRKVLQAKQVEFVSITEKFDTTTPAGKAMMDIVIVFAELERATIAQRIRDNMLQLARSGRWLGGNRPTGYKSKEIIGSYALDGKIRKAYKLEIVPEEIEIVKIIFQKFLEFNSLTKTETYLLQNHIVTQTGRKFSIQGIRAILKNPVYAKATPEVKEYFGSRGAEVCSADEQFDNRHGMMVYNKTMESVSSTNKERPMEEWIVAVGKHRGVIAGGDWLKAQRFLQQNASKAFRKPRSNVALLSGLLFCGSCGSHMRPKATQRKNAEGQYVFNYLCETKEKSRGQLCQMETISGNQLDKMVCEEIVKQGNAANGYLKMLRSLQKKIQNDEKFVQMQLDSLRKQKKEIEKRIENSVKAFSTTDSEATHRLIEKQIEELQVEQKDISERLKKQEELASLKIISNEEIERMQKYLSDYGNAFRTLSIEEKRDALRLFVKKVIWDGEKAHIYFFGHSEDDLCLDEKRAAEPALQMCGSAPRVRGAQGARRARARKRAAAGTKARTGRNAPSGRVFCASASFAPRALPFLCFPFIIKIYKAGLLGRLRATPGRAAHTPRRKKKGAPLWKPTVSPPARPPWGG